MADDAYEDHLREEERAAKFRHSCCTNPRRVVLRVTIQAEPIVTRIHTPARGRAGSAAT